MDIINMVLKLCKAVDLVGHCHMPCPFQNGNDHSPPTAAVTERREGDLRGLARPRSLQQQRSLHETIANQERSQQGGVWCRGDEMLGETW